MRPLVLLANDDGIDSPYLEPTIAALEGRAGVEVMVVVPNRERSAASHAISLHKPLRVSEVADNRFTVSGTPVDGLALAVLELAQRPIDLVVSGINRGFNLGGDVYYSGTVAVAADAVLRGIPGLAVSMGPRHEGDIDLAAGFAAALVASLLRAPLGRRAVLNVNIPATADGRYQWTRLGDRLYSKVIHKRTDPRGRPYYWMAGEISEVANPHDSDCYAVERGIIAITPLAMDRTDHELRADPPDLAIDGPGLVAVP